MSIIVTESRSDWTNDGNVPVSSIIIGNVCSLHCYKAILIARFELLMDEK